MLFLYVNQSFPLHAFRGCCLKFPAIQQSEMISFTPLPSCQQSDSDRVTSRFSGVPHYTLRSYHLMLTRLLHCHLFLHPGTKGCELNILCGPLFILGRTLLGAIGRYDPGSWHQEHQGRY